MQDSSSSAWRAADMADVDDTDCVNMVITPEQVMRMKIHVETAAKGRITPGYRLGAVNGWRSLWKIGLAAMGKHHLSPKHKRAQLGQTSTPFNALDHALELHSDEPLDAGVAEKPLNVPKGQAYAPWRCGSKHKSRRESSHASVFNAIRKLPVHKQRYLLEALAKMESELDDDNSTRKPEPIQKQCSNASRRAYERPEQDGKTAELTLVLEKLWFAMKFPQFRNQDLALKDDKSEFVPSGRLRQRLESLLGFAPSSGEISLLMKHFGGENDMVDIHEILYAAKHVRHHNKRKKRTRRPELSEKRVQALPALSRYAPSLPSHTDLDPMESAQKKLAEIAFDIMRLAKRHQFLQVGVVGVCWSEFRHMLIDLGGVFTTREYAALERRYKLYPSGLIDLKAFKTDMLTLGNSLLNNRRQRVAQRQFMEALKADPPRQGQSNQHLAYDDGASVAASDNGFLPSVVKPRYAVPPQHGRGILRQGPPRSPVQRKGDQRERKKTIPSKPVEAKQESKCLVGRNTRGLFHQQEDNSFNQSTKAVRGKAKTADTISSKPPVPIKGNDGLVVAERTVDGRDDVFKVPISHLPVDWDNCRNQPGFVIFDMAAKSVSASVARVEEGIEGRSEQIDVHSDLADHNVAPVALRHEVTETGEIPVEQRSAIVSAGEEEEDAYDDEDFHYDDDEDEEASTASQRALIGYNFDIKQQDALHIDAEIAGVYSPPDSAFESAKLPSSVQAGVPQKAIESSVGEVSFAEIRTTAKPTSQPSDQEHGTEDAVMYGIERYHNDHSGDVEEPSQNHFELYTNRNINVPLPVPFSSMNASAAASNNAASPELEAHKTANSWESEVEEYESNGVEEEGLFHDGVKDTSSLWL